MVEQEGDCLVDRFGVNEMIVVEDEQERVREGGDVVEQGNKDRFDLRWLGGLEGTQRPFPNLWRHCPERGDQVFEEARRVAIGFVEREPGDRTIATGDPFAEQGGFAKARRGGDEGDFVVQAIVETRDESRPGDSPWPGPGDIEFGHQDLRGHFRIIGHTVTPR